MVRRCKLITSEPANWCADIYSCTNAKLFEMLFAVINALLIKLHVLQKSVHTKRSALESMLHRGLEETLEIKSELISR